MNDDLLLNEYALQIAVRKQSALRRAKRARAAAMRAESRAARGEAIAERQSRRQAQQDKKSQEAAVRAAAQLPAATMTSSLVRDQFTPITVHRALIDRSIAFWLID